MAGRLAAVGDRTVAHRQIGAGIAEARRGMVEEQRAHLGAGQAQGDAAELDRLAARGVAFVRGQIGVAGLQQDALGRDVELVGGDLQHRGQHPLADLDPAGRDRHTAGRRKPDPLIEPRIAGEQRRQCRWCAHRAAPSRTYGGGAFDGAQDADVAAAAADVVVERVGDLVPRRRRVMVEQRLGRDQDAGQAIAALAGLLVEKGLLQRVRPLRRAEPFDRQ